MHQVVFTLYHRDRADTMSTANGVGIHFAHPPVKYLALLYKLTASLGYHFDGRVRVDAMLVEDAECLDTKIAERVLAYVPDVLRRAVLLSLHLHAIDELVSELGGDEHTVGVSPPCLTHQTLVHRVSVALGGIEEVHATLHSLMHKCYLHLSRGMLAAVMVQAHAAEAHHRDRERCLTATQSALFSDGCHARRYGLRRFLLTCQRTFCRIHLVKSRLDTHCRSCQCRHLEETSAAHIHSVCHIWLPFNCLCCKNTPNPFLCCYHNH